MSTNSGIPTPAPANTLEAMTARKQQLDDDLRAIEKIILESEETYLEDTNHYGNVVKGWDGFLTSRPKPHGASHHATKRVMISKKDRVFSLSSTTAPIDSMLGDDQEDMDMLGGMPLTFKGDSLSSMRGQSLGRNARQSKSGDGDELSD